MKHLNVLYIRHIYLLGIFFSILTGGVWSTHCKEPVTETWLQTLSREGDIMFQNLKGFFWKEDDDSNNKEGTPSNSNNIPPGKSCETPPRTSNEDGPSDQEPKDSSGYLKGYGTTAAVVAGGVTLAAGAPVVLTGIGFTSAGIAAGSYAAGMMSAAASAAGGNVVAGSLVAVLQSAGAAGLGSATSAALGGAGAGIGYGVSKILGRSSGNENGSDDGENSDTSDNIVSDKNRGGCDDNGGNDNGIVSDGSWFGSFSGLFEKNQ